METNIERFIFENKADWKEFRKGLFTSSQINRLTANGKSDSGLSVGAITYILETINDIKGEPKPDVFNYAMEWGLEQEPQAVIRYATDNNLDINADDFIYTSVGGFVFFKYLNIAGGTPDLILKDTIVEIKCPNSETHLYNLLFVNAENIQKEYPVYYDQCQMNMFLTQKKKAVFMSYDSRIKDEKNQAHYIAIEFDSLRIETILNKINVSHNFRKQLLIKLNNGSSI